MRPKAIMNASESNFSPTKGWISVCSRASVAPDSAVAITSTAPSRFSSTQSGDASFQARQDNFDEDKAYVGMERLVLRQVVDPAEDSRARSARKEVMFRTRRTVRLDKDESVIRAKADFAVAIGLFDRLVTFPNCRPGVLSRCVVCAITRILLT